MARFKKISLRLLFPPLGAVLVSVPLAAVLLFYVFFSGHEHTPVAYVTYVLSAYALTILCARLVRMPKPDVRARLHQNPLSHRYLTDVHVQMRVSLYRQYQSPVMSAAKAIKLVAALVSMLSLETAMLEQFGNGQDPGFRQLMTGLTGGCACLIVLGMGIYMIVRAGRRLNEMEKSSQ